MLQVQLVHQVRTAKKLKGGLLAYVSVTKCTAGSYHRYVCEARLQTTYTAPLVFQRPQRPPAPSEVPTAWDSENPSAKSSELIPPTEPLPAAQRDTTRPTLLESAPLPQSERVPGLESAPLLQILALEPRTLALGLQILALELQILA